jgi:hypothetical protein
MRYREGWEWILLLAAIASLWPKILHWPGWYWDALLYLMGALLLGLLWVRIRRFRALLDEQQRSSHLPPPKFPWERNSQ